MESQKTNFEELAKGIINPDTVALSLGHLFQECFENNEQYSNTVGCIIGHMLQITPKFEFDRVVSLLVLKKRPDFDINYKESVCCKGAEEALRMLVEPKLSQLGERTKGHIQTLANEVPHLSHVFMDFHGRIVCNNGFETPNYHGKGSEFGLLFNLHPGESSLDYGYKFIIVILAKIKY